MDATVNKIILVSALLISILVSYYIGHGNGYEKGYFNGNSKSQEEVVKLARAKFMASYLFAVRNGAITVNTNRLAELEAEQDEQASYGLE